MFRRFSVNFALFSMALDAGLIMGILLIAAYLRPALNAVFPFAAEYPQYVAPPWLLYPVFAFIWISIFLLLSVYDGRHSLRVVDELTRLTAGSLLAAVSLAGTLYLSYREVSRLLFLVFVAGAYFGMLAWRLTARLALRRGNGQQHFQHQVMIAGAGQVGRQFAGQLNKVPELGLHLVGYLDDDPEKRLSTPEIVGTTSEARQKVTELGVDDVVIALPQYAHETINRLVVDLHTLPVKVWIIPDYFHLALHKAAVEDFAGLPMLDLRAPALNEYQRMVKRAFDLTMAVLLLLPSLLLMGLIALAIRLEGPGPILFQQQRVGENGRLFPMLKFRTMVPGAEDLRYLVEYTDEEGNLIHKSADDPRVTRVGRFLRRTSLDELPQLANILRGDMSLVGPRPELPYLVERYEAWQRKRFAVPQGVTGWWQINGRSDKPMHLHTEDDLYYVQHYSLWLDLQILIRTVGVVLRGKGAY